MATLDYKLINPIRIFNPQRQVDYNNNWPFIDLQRLDQVYHKGVYNEQIFDVDWRRGKQLSIQVIIENSLTGGLSAKFFDQDGNEFNGTPTVTNVTPLGYTANSFIKIISITPSVSGIYRFQILGDGFTPFNSDWINISDNSDKSLVEIRYRDNQNRYGGYFWKTSTNNVWFPRAYYTGSMIPAQPESDDEEYTDEDGAEYILDSTPQRVQTLLLNDIHLAYVDTIKRQSVCSEFYVNNILVSATDFTFERIPNTYLCNVSMKLKLKENINELII